MGTKEDVNESLKYECFMKMKWCWFIAVSPLRVQE